MQGISDPATGATPVDHLAWFRDARFGLFLHWGSYTLKGFEASWPLVYGDISYAEYEALAERFNPQCYDPEEWAALAKAAGVRYAVLTSKHHDGYALYDTQLSDYSAPQRAAGRDLLAPYVEAFRAAGIKVGFYFSLCDWHHPDYPATSDVLAERPRLVRPEQALPPGAYKDIAADPARWERYLAFMHGQVRELCTRFGQIDLLWFDGQWEHSAEEWRAQELVQMIRDLQPEIVINDRLADRMLGDYATPEQNVPVQAPDRMWETCMTINETWAYNPRDRAFKSSAEIMATLIETASKGGNLLLNVGPSAEGEILPEFSSRLEVIGAWLARNSEAIYGAGPGLPPGAYYGPSTGKQDAIYLHVLGQPAEGAIRVRGLGRRVVRASVLGTGAPLEFDQHGGHLEEGFLRLTLPSAYLEPLATVVKLQLAPAGQ
jgi:alpha-L-fucosidase